MKFEDLMMLQAVGEVIETLGCTQRAEIELLGFTMWLAIQQGQREAALKCVNELFDSREAQAKAQG